MENQYLDVNKQLWNNKVAHHAASDFYDVPSFLAGRNSLNAIELALLGDVQGKSVLHLQCHFGQDTISLARMGAVATGIDISDKAIDKANELAAEAGTEARFICSDVYGLPEVLEEQFDIVFTSYGTVGWLPDMDRWAGIVARYLKPGGRFVFAEFHPAIWMYDDNFEKIIYSYFNDEAIITQQQGTYADNDAPLHDAEVGWNHPLTEVIGALLAQGLSLSSFKEYNYSPYNCFKDMEEFEPGKFRIAHFGNKIPFVYSLVCNK
jgi:ubiquinone/menaquinone biosynthesis C-methylase UbiE